MRCGHHPLGRDAEQANQHVDAAAAVDNDGPVVIREGPPATNQIALTVGATGAETNIAVTDNGPGISPDDIPHVFDRFWRADRVRSRASERGGFGLGLAISQWIVQAHGGSLTAQSRLGRGSIFSVVLPVVTQAVELKAVPVDATGAAE